MGRKSRKNGGQRPDGDRNRADEGMKSGGDTDENVKGAKATKRQKAAKKNVTRTRGSDEVTPSDPFSLLSDSLLLRVFSHLRTPDLVEVSRVSRRFNRVSYDASLWIDLKFSWNYSDRPPTKTAVALFDRCQKLKVLEVDTRQRFEEDDYYAFSVALTALKKCPHLRELTVGGQTDDGLVSSLLTAVGKSSSLKKLDLIGDLNPKVLVAKASCLAGLTELSLLLESGPESGLSGEDMAFIGRHCRRLETFSIICGGFDVSAFLREIKSTIRKLTFRSFSFSDDLSGLVECRKLRSLSIDDSDPKGDFLRHHVSRLGGLTELRLNNSDAELLPEVKDFVFAFENGKLRNLLTLDLRGCQSVERKVLMVVAQNCPNLKDLDISRCGGKVDDVGVGMILRNCGSLKTLQMESAGATVTSKAFRNLPSPSLLRELMIESSGPCIAKEELLKIKQMLPELKIFDEKYEGRKEWSYEKHCPAEYQSTTIWT